MLSKDNMLKESSSKESAPNDKKASKPDSTVVEPKIPIMQSGVRWLWLTVIFFALDQLSKYLAVNYIQPREVIEVMPFFNLVIRYNPGAAFSFLADAGGWQHYFFSSISAVVSCGIVYWMSITPAKNRWLSLSLAFILSGALGNLYDRLTIGEVVDFIDWYYGDYHWPAFNIADAAIMVGAVMMLIDGFLVNSKEKTDD